MLHMKASNFLGPLGINGTTVDLQYKHVKY